MMKKNIANILIVTLLVTSLPSFADDDSSRSSGGGGGGGGAGIALGVAAIGLLIWALTGKKSEVGKVEKESSSKDASTNFSVQPDGAGNNSTTKNRNDGLGSNQKLEY